MEIRTITPDYAVSPMIAPQDVSAIADAGFKIIICNRPDAEVPPILQANAMRTAAEAAGLTFIVNPVTHQGLNMDIVAIQKAAAMQGPTLAYCASGTRSTIVWALGQADEMSADDIIAAAGQAGYDISGLRSQLETRS